MMTSFDIRKAFFDFFRERGHQIVPSASIVIKNDPTLLFTNAGMNQFKDIFLGNKSPVSTRVADTQKCLRVSGKHNDLEEVGVDTYHHTMFEMLGNWSFGDYFKKEAIAWSWELLTEVYKIPKDRLYVTIFEGDAAENLPMDEEAFQEWKHWIDESRIVPGNKKDNFWEMGDTGPCGPCTEIHVDCRPDIERAEINGRSLVNNDHPQVIEIWNNVFIQFKRLKDGSLEPLPARHVDTGMGLERLVRVLQQKSSNYDTDIFSGTIEATEKLTSKKYTAGDGKPDIAFRVIADHIRAIAFTIADGQLPSNTGAGYVIRRVLRRAVRYYYSYLDMKQPLLHQLIAVLAEQFREVFPELLNQSSFVSKVVKEEEDAFLRTLDKGLKKIDDIIRSATSANQKRIDGKAAFELYDTYGFPVDLTRLIARENGLDIDETAFENEMQQQKNRSRAAASIDTEDWVMVEDQAFKEFVGYDTLEIKTKLARYRKIKTKDKETYQLVLTATPFYAESGGQIGDTGEIISADEIVSVTGTKKENDLIIHFTDRLPAPLGAGLTAKVDASKRKAVALHHSATHLLHAALRQVLGKHVAQKGSLVNESQLRFDFSHFAKVTEEEMQMVETIVNEKIRENIPVIIREMPKDEAMALGAMALFGEKYGDIVRVVIIDPSYSVELCGGTHALSTGELGFFTIRHETAVAAGVRRIEAVCGLAAENYIQENFLLLRQARALLKNPKDLLKSIESLQQDLVDATRKAEKQEARQLLALKQSLADKFLSLGDTPFLGEIVEVGNADSLRKLATDLKSQEPDAIIVLAANIEGKATVVVGLSDTFINSHNLDAPSIIKQHIAPLIKGGGGGQKTLATAGGTDVSRLQEVVEAVRIVASGKGV